MRLYVGKLILGGDANNIEPLYLGVWYVEPGQTESEQLPTLKEAGSGHSPFWNCSGQAFSKTPTWKPSKDKAIWLEIFFLLLPFPLSSEFLQVHRRYKQDSEVLRYKENLQRCLDGSGSL